MSAVSRVWKGALVRGLKGFDRRRQPQTGGDLHIQGLEEEVEVIRDRWGIPHIYAGTIHDLMFAQGFVHAQDRLWQMDFQRRLVEGRLSEVLGKRAGDIDRWTRVLGMHRAAREEVPLLDPAERAELEAYAAGVTAGATRAALPIEFILLRYEPEPWHVEDTLSWIKMVSWMLSGNWQVKILRKHFLERLGPELAAELEVPLLSNWSCIIPSGDGKILGRIAFERALASQSFVGPGADAGLGSNSWVVAGARTESGAPLLANDMHLLLNAPAVFYENHLIGGGRNVTGVTFPGIPGVVVGHNGHVAWGFTNACMDVQDLYIERLRWTDDGRVQYEFEGEWHDARVEHERIHVRGGEDLVEEVIVTRHGPIINALNSAFLGEEPLALHWVSLEPGLAGFPMQAVNGARNCLEFREALRRWTAPAQNVVYADTDGHIGYTMAGKVPMRARGDGQVPVPGWTGEYEWEGYIPFEELPHLYDPPEGYIATANNQIVDEGYPYYLGCQYVTGDRAARIHELIGARETVDVAYMQAMQFDWTPPVARIVGAYLGQLSVDDAELAEVVARMGEWGGELGAGSAEAAVYQVFLRRMLYLMVEDKLGDVARYFVGEGPVPVLSDHTTFGIRAPGWLQHLLDQPESHWYDLGHGETRDDVMRIALRQTVDFLKDRLGPDMHDWAWSGLHTVTFGHLLGQVPTLRALFSRGPYPIGGDITTLWATGAAGPSLDAPGNVGPPFRFIADLGDLRHAWAILAPGQSGRPGSRHYDDQLGGWFTRGYHPVAYARDDVERHAEDRLRLLPM